MLPAAHSDCKNESAGRLYGSLALLQTQDNVGHASRQNDAVAVAPQCVTQCAGVHCCTTIDQRQADGHRPTSQTVTKRRTSGRAPATVPVVTFRVVLDDSIPGCNMGIDMMESWHLHVPLLKCAAAGV